MPTTTPATTTTTRTPTRKSTVDIAGTLETTPSSVPSPSRHSTSTTSADVDTGSASSDNVWTETTEDDATNVTSSGYPHSTAGVVVTTEDSMDSTRTLLTTEQGIVSTMDRSGIGCRMTGKGCVTTDSVGVSGTTSQPVEKTSQTSGFPRPFSSPTPRTSSTTKLVSVITSAKPPASKTTTTTTTTTTTMKTTTTTTVKSPTSTGRNERSNQNRAGTAKGSDKADGDDSESSMVVVVVAVVVGVAVIGLAAAGGFLLYKRKQRYNTGNGKLVPYENVEEHDLNNGCAVVQMEVLNTNQQVEADVVYANMLDSFSVTLEAVPMETFDNHIEYMKKVNGFDKEFKELPQGFQASTTAADEASEGEIRKNRFTNIAPYDDSRVVLVKEIDSDSDYINASYIDGFKEVKAYIAAQGPMPVTVKDFWHMVWDEGCGKIVMLTNLVEGAKPKCEQYWPKKEASMQTFGRYSVTLVKVTERAHFTHRILDVSKDGEETGQHQVHQFHFTAWPDHGVPCALALVHFWHTVTLQSPQLDGPMVVHCSAGIGRTGTFIALDMLINQALTIGKVSVFPTVKRLRKQRVNMVQTLCQYECLHEALLEWHSVKDSQLVKDDLVHGATWTYKDGEDVHQLPEPATQLVQQQFQTLEKLRPVVDSEDLKTASLEVNANKNRSTNILPVERYRVCLWVPDTSVSDYINAIFLPCLRQQQGYIVTQLPLSNTLGDFWQMVVDWRVKDVVQFSDAPPDQAVEMYSTGEGGELQCGSVHVHTATVSVFSPAVKVFNIKLTLQEHSEEGVEQQKTSEVNVYCVESQAALSLNSTASFLSLANALLPSITTASQPPLVLQCFDGAGLSCALGCLMMSLENLEVDQRTSVLSMARLVHTARPQAFTTQEQFDFVVRCIVHQAKNINDSASSEKKENSEK